MKNFLLLVMFLPQFLSAQKLTKSDKAIIENLKTQITFLAGDKLEGRRTGTKGEQLAYEYLVAQFEKAGLAPKGEQNGYLQPFEIDEGKQVLPATYFTINGDALQLDKDFFPFIFSANGSVKESASPALREKEVPWFWDISELIEDNKSNPHFDLVNAIKNKAVESAKMGASAFIVFNSGSQDDELQFEGKSKIPQLNIPVVFVTKAAAKKYLSDNSSDLELSINVALAEKKRTGHNVVGYIDNGAAQTIILGAHYDHLGYGEDHTSLWTGKPEIHNGADDNASGVAAILEVAKLLKKSKLKNNNYLFILFSGEELGLFGSKYFAEHPTIDLGSVNYMINCDMVGRLDESSNTMMIGGYGTSPTWGQVLPQKTKTINVKFDSSGIGPSDHTSFYLKNIPVLFFFTGVHKDYHKPTDDVEKINFTGQLHIIRYIYNVINETNKLNKLTFTKTREPQMGGPRFTVSLGIMPDYSFTGAGVRADGIIDGKIAQQAGILTGDVITKVGTMNVADINSYMTALSKYKKGDAATVTVLRGNEEKSFDIVF